MHRSLYGMPEMLCGAGNELPEERWRGFQNDTDGKGLCRDVSDVLKFCDA